MTYETLRLPVPVEEASSLPGCYNPQAPHEPISDQKLASIRRLYEAEDRRFSVNGSGPTPIEQGNIVAVPKDSQSGPDFVRKRNPWLNGTHVEIN